MGLNIEYQGKANAKELGRCLAGDCVMLNGDPVLVLAPAVGVLSEVPAGGGVYVAFLATGCLMRVPHLRSVIPLRAKLALAEAEQEEAKK